MQALPTTWELTTLGQCCDIVAGQHLMPHECNSERKGIAYLTGPADFQERIPVPSRWTEAPRAIAKQGDVLITVKGAGVGKSNLAIDACIGRQLMALRPLGGTHTTYIFYWLRAAFNELSSLALGATVPGVAKPQIESFSIPLAPVQEQARIVEKLEKLIFDLDSGVTDLLAAQADLVRYRQTLLKSALDGSLTADWRDARAKINESTETGVQLLERLLVERRTRWEVSQHARLKEQGKTIQKDWQAKYPEPILPDMTSLPELPSGWAWASLDMIGEIVSGVAKGTKRDSNISLREVPYLRVANVQRGYLDLNEVKTILATDDEIAELTLKDGDVLFNEGGDRDKLGRGWVWHDEIPGCIHQNHVFRMRPYLPEILPELVSYHGNSFGKAWFQTAGKQTTNLASINIGILRSFPVPIPPAIEQRQILSRLRHLLDKLNMQEKSVELGLTSSENQRKNILKAAFSGELTPQDPQDEPAKLLLARISTERVERVKQPQPRKSRIKESIAMASKLIEVLTEAGDWLLAQEAFRRCGVTDGTQTDKLEELYAELRKLDKAKQLAVETVTDSQGRKVADRLRLVIKASV